MSKGQCIGCGSFYGAPHEKDCVRYTPPSVYEILQKDNTELKEALATAESAAYDLMELNDKLTAEVKVYDNNFCVMEQLFIESQEEVEALKADRDSLREGCCEFARVEIAKAANKVVLDRDTVNFLMARFKLLNHKEG